MDAAAHARVARRAVRGLSLAARGRAQREPPVDVRAVLTRLARAARAGRGRPVHDHEGRRRARDLRRLALVRSVAAV